MDPFVDLPEACRPASVDLAHEAHAHEARIGFTLPLSSGWFDGHFPGRPILPGVTQVHLAALAAGRIFNFGSSAVSGESLRVIGTRRLKFQRPVQPATPLLLELAIDAQPATRLRFTLRCDGEIASSGTLIVSAAPPVRQ